MNETNLRYNAIIVAAGKGERSEQAKPKQYVDVAGKPMLRWSVERFVADPQCTHIIVVIGVGQATQAHDALVGIDGITLIEGGATRQQSVRNGLAAIDNVCHPEDLVLIHDAARPFLPQAVIDRLLSALSTAQGAVPVLEVADTMVETNNEGLGQIVPREQLRRVQTPQAFQYRAIIAAHEDAVGAEASDDAQLLRAVGASIVMVEGSTDLNKITFAEEFALAESRFGGARRIVMGMGYDVHRLVPDKQLWIGGIQIAHSHGLSGHSDADVALHALTDAILGALAEGDIGQHFPPTDAKWKGASSDKFLAFAGERVTARGGTVQSLDLTIICEAPKIGPHRDAMRQRIAEILQLPVGLVSVKATTTEGLGFAGRREGIAAQAIASISLPFSD